MDGQMTSRLLRVFLTLACYLAVVKCDTLCTQLFGTCKYKSGGCSGGNFVRNLCDGPYDRQCCVPDYTYADRRCTGGGGTCQRTSTYCRGRYESGICGGPWNRKCCLPPSGSSGSSSSSSGSGGSCSREVQNLACELYNSRNVEAATVHPSNEKDNAYARNNLRDVCNGGQAARSSYGCSRRCDAPGGYTCLSATLLRYLVDLKDNGSIHINELAGACHSCGSKHYSGLAVDLEQADPRTGKDRTREILDKCERYGGWGDDEGTHIHCQF